MLPISIIIHYDPEFFSRCLGNSEASPQDGVRRGPSKDAAICGGHGGVPPGVCGVRHTVSVFAPQSLRGRPVRGLGLPSSLHYRNFQSDGPIPDGDSGQFLHP